MRTAEKSSQPPMVTVPSRSCDLDITRQAAVEGKTGVLCGRSQRRRPRGNQPRGLSRRYSAIYRF